MEESTMDEEVVGRKHKDLEEGRKEKKDDVLGKRV